MKEGQEISGQGGSVAVYCPDQRSVHLEHFWVGILFLIDMHAWSPICT